MIFQPDIIEKIRKIRLMIFDVDGVLTDGRIIYTDTGVEIKAFDVQDGHGMKLLVRSGIDLGIITGRYSRATEIRAQEIGIKYVRQNAKNKLEAYEEILSESGYSDEQVGYMGDDLIDIPVMRRVGWSVAVPNANHHIFPYAHYITQKSGGRGACREVCEIILKVQNKWESVTDRYFKVEAG